MSVLRDILPTLTGAAAALAPDLLPEGSPEFLKKIDPKFLAAGASGLTSAAMGNSLAGTAANAAIGYGLGNTMGDLSKTGQATADRQADPYLASDPDMQGAPNPNTAPAPMSRTEAIWKGLNTEGGLGKAVSDKQSWLPAAGGLALGAISAQPQYAPMPSAPRPAGAPFIPVQQRTPLNPTVTPGYEARYFANGGPIDPVASMDQVTGGGGYLNGPTDGRADKVPMTIKNPDGSVSKANAAHGEYIIPAWDVAALGGGNNEAGAKVLDALLKNLRKQAGLPEDPQDLKKQGLNSLMKNAIKDSGVA